MAVNKKHVFISHAEEDKTIASRVAAILESRGVECWYSSKPGAIPSGTVFEEKLVEAIRGSRAVILLMSKSANSSRWVQRELSYAAKHCISIHPIHIENVEATGALDLYLTSLQRIDAYDRDLGEALDDFVRWLTDDKSLPAPQTGFAPNKRRSTQHLIGALLLIATFVSSAAAMLVYFWVPRISLNQVKLVETTWGTGTTYWLQVSVKKTGFPDPGDCRIFLSYEQVGKSTSEIEMTSIRLDSWYMTEETNDRIDLPLAKTNSFAAFMRCNGKRFGDSVQATLVPKRK